MLLSPDEVKSLQERRERALAAPLAPDAVLVPSGLPLHLDALTPTNDELDAFPSSTISLALESPNPYRPFNSALRGHVSRRSGWRALRFRLLDGLCLNECSPAQVWRVEVSSDEEVLGTAVLKLVVEAIFSGLLVDSGEWTPACDAVESELRAYAAFRPVQGRDVPHCYGAFPFSHPSGEMVTDVLLEDLSEVSLDASDWCDKEKAEGRLQDIEGVDLLMTTAFHTVHRLQALGITHFELGLFDILVLNSSTPSTLYLVFLDFSGTDMAQSALALEREERLKDARAFPRQSDDEHSVRHLMTRLLGDVAGEWVYREVRTKRTRAFTRRHSDGI